jgi:hypothetical protein
VGAARIGEAAGLVAEGLGLLLKLAPHGFDLGALLGEPPGQLFVLVPHPAPQGLQLGLVGAQALGETAGVGDELLALGGRHGLGPRGRALFESALHLAAETVDLGLGEMELRHLFQGALDLGVEAVDLGLAEPQLRQLPQATHRLLLNVLDVPDLPGGEVRLLGGELVQLGIDLRHLWRRGMQLRRHPRQLRAQLGHLRDR